MQYATALTQVTASVDKNPVMINESIVLTVVANDDVNTNAFDASPLQKDFVVGRTSVSSQTSIINGRATRTTTWSTLLMPKSLGGFTIPSFSIENEKTQPIALIVIDKPQSSSAQQDIFIKAEVSSPDVYVQELLTLTVKLYFSIELKRGSLSDPALTDANVTQIGEDKETNEIVQGIRYRVIERNYAISPQKSGTFTISPPTFQGEVVAQNQRRSSFLSFADTKPVSVRGDSIDITVKPIPSQYQGDWLPSELLTLHQEWQPKESEFKVGEPITRTLTLTAQGLSQEQLPLLEMTVPKGLKVYPDQADLHTSMNSQRLVSQKVQNFAVVASKAGEYELPEMRIPWWNTVTNKMQIALIPAQKITIKANSEWGNSPSSLQAESVTVNTVPTATPEKIYVNSWLQWLFLFLWLSTSLAWYISSRKVASPKKLTVKSNNTYKLLLAACKKNQGDIALQQILPWLNEHFSTSKISTLDDAIHWVNNDSFTQALHNLQACYYGKSTQNWQGDELLSCIKNIENKKTTQSQPVSLNP